MVVVVVSGRLSQMLVEMDLPLGNQTVTATALV